MPKGDPLTSNALTFKPLQVFDGILDEKIRLAKHAHLASTSGLVELLQSIQRDYRDALDLAYQAYRERF